MIYTVEGFSKVDKHRCCNTTFVNAFPNTIREVNLSRNVSSAEALVASYSDLNSLTNSTVALLAGPSP